jgi:hypothetical protein
VAAVPSRSSSTNPVIAPPATLPQMLAKRSEPVRRPRVSIRRAQASHVLSVGERVAHEEAVGREVALDEGGHAERAWRVGERRYTEQSRDAHAELEREEPELGSVGCTSGGDARRPPRTESGAHCEEQ